MTVTVGEPLSNHLYLYGFYEEGLTRFMLAKVTPGMTVVDIGAHYGYFTLLASHLVGPRGSVHAFEPTPSTYNVLATNAARRANIEPNPVAAWHISATLELQDFGSQRSMFNTLVAPRAGIEGAVKVDVPAVPVGDYLAGRDLVPGFIKIDAESAELHVIQGLRATLREHHPMLTVEVGDIPGHQRSSREMIETICGEYGYQPLEFAEGVIRPHALKSRYEYDNILLV